ncbi:MAG: hypothetical protein DMG07_03735 [Acidobacteria bacterium]|nr:MAG: hypothetical protein DMG07_03735 [Acidobacteriota bacterium]
MARRGFRSGRALLAIGALGGLLPGCTTLRVPARIPDFPAGELVRTSVEQVALEAFPVEGREANWELFDDYLPEIGIAAVWVSVRNDRGAAVDLTGLRWELKLGSKVAASLGRDEVLKRFYKGRKVRMYSLAADRSARDALERVLFRPGKLAPGARASGFVFLKLDPGQISSWARNGVLVGRGARLQDGRQIELRAPLGERPKRRSGAETSPDFPHADP